MQRVGAMALLAGSFPPQELNEVGNFVMLSCYGSDHYRNFTNRKVTDFTFIFGPKVPDGVKNRK